MIEFRDVSYRIGEKQILFHISLQVEAGERLVLLGRSGSGKTTALKMVNGLIQSTEGSVLVDGKPLAPSRKSVEWCSKGVERCWSQKKRFIRAAEKDDAEKAYEHARMVYKGKLEDATD